MLYFATGNKTYLILSYLSYIIYNTDDNIYNTDKKRFNVKTHKIEMLPAPKPETKNYIYIYILLLL